MLITVCSERSSCPCFAAALTESRYHVRSAHEIFKVQLPKRKIPPTQRSDDFVGWIGGKMNQVCCGAVNLSGIIHGEAVFKMNTTTSCGKVQTNPQEQWDLQEKYHCMWKSSRGFWKIYGNKVEGVGLLTAYFGFKWIKTVSGLFLRSGRCR